jgi:outer membrane protein, adhesin transport system
LGACNESSYHNDLFFITLFTDSSEVIMPKSIFGLLIIMCFIFVVSQSHAQESVEIPLEETPSGVLSNTQASVDVKSAVLQAIESNPDIQASWHIFRASIEEVKVVRAGYFPKVDLAASTGKAERDYRGPNNESLKYSTDQLQLTLSQMLFDGFRTSAQVSRFDEARMVRYYEFLNTIEATALDAVKAFQDVRRNRELVNLARENYAKHLEVHDQIKQRTNSGVGRGVDLEQVIGRLALAESNLITEASNLHDVSARYLRVVGQLPIENFVPSNLASQQLPDSIRSALTLAYQGNPGFHAAIKNISAAQEQVRVEKSGYYPTAELRARGVRSRNQNGFDEVADGETRGTETGIELAINYNLYSGGENRASIRRSLEEVSEAKDLRDQACVDLRQTTQIAYNDTFRIRDRLVSLEQHRVSSGKVRTAYFQQFKIGQRSLLDLLDAENEYFQASRALITARAELETAYARSFAAMGGILPALGIARESLALLQNTQEDDSLEITESVCPYEAPEAVSRTQLLNRTSPLRNVQVLAQPEPPFVNEVLVQPASADLQLRGDSLFDVGSAKLKSGATEKLDKFVNEIRKMKVKQITVEGHTDNTGSDKLNVALSSARAQQVRDYLVAQGLTDIPISVQGFGSARPVEDNSIPAGRAANRRVDIKVEK